MQTKRFFVEKHSYIFKYDSFGLPPGDLSGPKEVLTPSELSAEAAAVLDISQILTVFSIPLFG